MENKQIYLNDILNIKPEDYKDWTICLNNAKQGDSVYSFDENEERLIEHISWKKSASRANSFRLIKTKYCLEFLRLDDISHEWWLFLGAYEVRGIIKYENGNERYDLKRMDYGSQYVERLIVGYKKHQGDKQAKIRTSYLQTMPVIKILDRKYINISKRFDGYNNVRLSFTDLKKIVDANVDSWKVSLSNIYGIYVIADTKTGKLYVGSAYGKDGIWQRWSYYVSSNGTGGNKELDKIIKEDPTYSKNFQFSLLEVIADKRVSNDYVIERETHWKEVLQSKEWGYNDN